MKPGDKIYVTKYALSGGASVREVMKVDHPYVWVSGQFSHGDMLRVSDCHSAWPEALARIEEMRMAKIASLEKQIAKLRKLNPKDPNHA